MYPEKNDAERQQIEAVFGLTGGELNDAPLRYATIVHGLAPVRVGALPPVEKLDLLPGAISYVTSPPVYYPGPRYHRRWARYFYDGCPDYDDRERKLGGDYITIVACELYGAMPRKILARGRTWVRVARYGHSGEAECLEYGSTVKETERDEHGHCILCAEGDVHGYIYLGEGWAEIVYKAKGS